MASQHKVIESTPDVFGAPIRAGDMVVHCVTSGRSATLTASRVLEVRERLGGYPEKWRTCLAVMKPGGEKTTIYFLSRVVRAPDGWTPPEGSDWRFA